MAAHVILLQIDPYLPATLSQKILTTHLREELNFSGLILSDDLRMNAIAHHYQKILHQRLKSQESSITEEYLKLSTYENYNDDYLIPASLDALSAGCDILLSCQSVTKEIKIFRTIAEKLTQDHQFVSEMLPKAWRIATHTITKI